MIYGNGTLEVSGSFGYGQGNILDLIVFAGQTENRTISINGEPALYIDFDSDAQTLTAYNLNLPFAAMNITLSSASNDGPVGSSSSSSSASSTAFTTATASQSSITGSVTTQVEPTVTSAAASISEAVAASVSAALSDLAGAESASPSASA
jgi:hypothetical protein